MYDEALKSLGDLVAGLSANIVGMGVALVRAGRDVEITTMSQERLQALEAELSDKVCTTLLPELRQQLCFRSELHDTKACFPGRGRALSDGMVSRGCPSCATRRGFCWRGSRWRVVSDCGCPSIATKSILECW